MIAGSDGVVERIVEDKDANAEERAHNALQFRRDLCADAKTLFRLLSMAKNDNAKGEFYLTDVVALGRAAGFDDACRYRRRERNAGRQFTRRTRAGGSGVSTARAQSGDG